MEEKDELKNFLTCLEKIVTSLKKFPAVERALCRKKLTFAYLNLCGTSAYH